MSGEPSSQREASQNATALKGKTGLTRLRNAARYSMDGLRAAYSDEQAFRQEVWAAVVLIPLALFLPVNAISKALMIGSIFLVLMVELLNSAIEALADRISQEKHILIKKAKDVGSAAVMLALINVVVVWALVLLV